MSSTISVSDRAMMQQSLGAIAKAKSDIEKTNNSVNSDVREDHYYNLPSTIAERSLFLENAIETHQKSMKNLQWSDSFFSELDNIVRSFSQTAQEARDIAATAMNHIGNEASFDINAESLNKLALLRVQLNETIHGHYVFGGSITTYPPVADITTNSNIVNDTITANYYQGDNFENAIYIDSDTFPYGIKANNQAFQQLIAGLHTLKDAKGEDGSFNKDIILRGAKLINEAIPVLNSMVERIGRTHATIRHSMEQKENAISYLSSMYDKLNGMDEITRAEKVMEINAQSQRLKIIFATTKKVLEMSLVNFY